MGRPLLALGLIAVAALLLGSLFAELEDSIEDPDPFSPDPAVAQKAAETAAAHPEYLQSAADAGAFQLLEDAEITIPPGGAEIDGDMVRLLEDVAWTLPPGTTIDDLTLPLAPGTEMHVPDGTRVAGESLVFPPGSSIVLADGTILELPEGGRLRIPGADPAALRADIADGSFTVPTNGGIFSAPRVQTSGEWPVTLPAGTTFGVPEGMTLPEGTLKDGGTFELPAGERLEPGTETGTHEKTAGEGLFDKLGEFALKPSEPDPKQEGTNGPAFPTFGAMPGGALWYWLVGIIVLGLAGWLVWRHRQRLRALVAGSPRTPGATAPRHPFRAIATLAGRPERLPLAVAPGDARTLSLRLERLQRGDAEGSARWTATGAELTVRLGSRTLHDGNIGPDGTEMQIPALERGDHALVIELRIPGHKRVTLQDIVRAAPWAEQVARDYDRLSEALHARTRLPDGFTPRILEQHALPLLPTPAHAPLSATLTVFERANYGRKDIDEPTWQRMAETTEALISALASPSATARRPGGASGDPLLDVA